MPDVVMGNMRHDETDASDASMHAACNARECDTRLFARAWSRFGASVNTSVRRTHVASTRALHIHQLVTGF